MTRETRTTIEPSDVIAVEFECRECGARIVVNLENFDKSPVFCPRCEKQWVIYNSDAHARLQSFLHRMKDYSKVKDEPYILRFEIKSDVSS
jgi:Zn finger protein HypA/HybF involved in hydrogenase expression